jgi:hypothetical protein
MKPKLDKRVLLLVVTVVGVILLVGLLSIYLPPAVDWESAYYPAARQLLLGRNPYDVYGYYNAPWALLPILPLVILTADIGRAAFMLLSLAGFSYAACKLGARPIALGTFLLSPPVMHCLLNASLDWMPLVGFVLPPRLGLFLVVVKPQVGATVALFWLVEAWRQGGLRQVVRVFWPVSLAFVLSFVIFGLWPFRAERLVGLWWNASLWPASIPVGLGLFAAALRTRNLRFAMGAAPCLSPYVLLHSWSGALAAIVHMPYETIATVVGLWILILIRARG